MTEIEITEEIQNKYLENPNVCPFCETNRLIGGHISADDDYANRDIRCENCGAEWTERFTLTEINNAFKNN